MATGENSSRGFLLLTPKISFPNYCSEKSATRLCEQVELLNNRSEIL